MKTLKKRLIYILIPLIVLSSCSAKKELAILQANHSTQQEKLDDVLEENKKVLLELISLKEENMSLQKENNDLKLKLVSARQSIHEISEQELECPEEFKKGLVFKVQIGAYEKRELPNELTTSVNLDVEKKKELQRIIVGQFRNYKKAKSLKTQLRAMGVSDAFIVPYVDDKRKQLDEVLADLSIQK